MGFHFCDTYQKALVDCVSVAEFDETLKVAWNAQFPTVQG